MLRRQGKKAAKNKNEVNYHISYNIFIEFKYRKVFIYIYTFFLIKNHRDNPLGK